MFFKIIGTFYSHERGASAVEFAIVGPVFVLLMMGMIAYGIYFGAVHSVQQLAADAARASVAGLDESERIWLAEQFIELNGDDYVLIDQDKLTIQVGKNPEDSTQFNVMVAYDASDLPIWNLYLPLPVPDSRILRQSTIRIGGI